jgi:penicillin-binding protein 2
MSRISSHDPERLEVLSRRATVFGGAFTLMLCVIGGRLFQLQIAEHKKYLDLANENQFNRRILAPLRGQIVDRFGVPLASNRRTFRLLFVPEQTKDLEGAFDAISTIIPLSPERRARIRRQMRRRGPYTPIEIESDLTWDQFARINYELPHLPGVLPEVGEARSYPLGDAAAFVVGYVGAVTDADLAAVGSEAEEVLLRQPGFKVGREGLERTYDKELRGKAGKLDVKVNAFGRVIAEMRDRAEPPTQGQTLALTIDAELQQKAMQTLAGESASAVVLDVVTGDVIVLASTPAFNPNDFNFGIKPDLWKELNASPYLPLLNKPISALYPPGSTFKMVSAIAGEVSGVSPNFTVSCPGKIWYGNRFFHCWKRGGHGGGINMRNAIKHSCDVYFYTLARNMDIDVLASVARKFGLGQTFDLGIPGEKRGVIPDRAWKKSYFAHSPANQPWFPGETLSVIIGQGYVTTTPLQLCVMAARLATGRDVRPRIVRVLGDVESPPGDFAPVDLDPRYLETIRAGMDAVTNDPGGTAYRSRLEEPEWRLAGKTGTSQVYQITAADRARGLAKPEDLPWERRDHALFVCYAPVQNPRYACAVVVEHGIGGSRAAGPKARDIMRAVMAKNPSALPAYDPRKAREAMPGRAG